MNAKIENRERNSNQYESANWCSDDMLLVAGVPRVDLGTIRIITEEEGSLGWLILPHKLANLGNIITSLLIWWRSDNISNWRRWFVFGNFSVLTEILDCFESTDKSGPAACMQESKNYIHINTEYTGWPCTVQACCPCVTTPTFTRHPREATLTLTYTARTTAPDTRLWVGRVMWWWFSWEHL